MGCQVPPIQPSLREPEASQMLNPRSRDQVRSEKLQDEGTRVRTRRQEAGGRCWGRGRGLGRHVSRFSEDPSLRQATPSPPGQ